MLEIKVNVEINAESLAAAVNRLADALDGAKAAAAPKASTQRGKGKATSHAESDAVIAAPATTEPAPAAPVPAAPTQLAPAPTAPAPVAPEPVAQPAPIPAAPVQAAPVAPAVIDLDAISRAGAALIDQGKMADVLNLLQKKYGIMAVTQLRPDQYMAFADDLRAMGANL